LTELARKHEGQHSPERKAPGKSRGRGRTNTADRGITREMTLQERLTRKNDFTDRRKKIQVTNKLKRGKTETGRIKWHRCQRKK